MKSSNILLVFITVPSLKKGNELAKKLLAKKLAACVNLIPKVESFYWWKGEIEMSEEVLLIVKTMKQKWKKLESFIRANHPYNVPEILGIESLNSSIPYAQWIRESLS
jgi:periplasmic divalent cation tolerance protein